MLNSHLIYQTRFTNVEDKFIVEFMSPPQSQSPGAKPIGVRIIAPFKNTTDEKTREKELNRLHRVLFNHLKAKFVAIENGLTEFMEEFMPHLIITDKNGNSSTMGQVILPQYVESIESGEQKNFNLLGDGKNT